MSEFGYHGVPEPRPSPEAWTALNAPVVVPVAGAPAPPEGYGAGEWGSQPVTTLEPLRPMRRLGQALTVLFVLWVIESGLSAASQWSTAGAARDAVRDPGALARLLAGEDREIAFGAVELLALLVTGVLFIVWLHRGATNARDLGDRPMRHSPGGPSAAGSSRSSTWSGPVRSQRRCGGAAPQRPASRRPAPGG